MSAITIFPFTFTWERSPKQLGENIGVSSPAFEAGGLEWKLKVSRKNKTEVGLHLQLLTSLQDGMKVRCRFELVHNGAKNEVIDRNFTKQSHSWGYTYLTPPINPSESNTFQVVIRVITFNEGFVKSFNERHAVAVADGNDRSLDRFMKFRRELIGLREDHHMLEELDALLDRVDAHRAVYELLDSSLPDILAVRKAVLANCKQSLDEIEQAEVITAEMREKRSRIFDELLSFEKSDSYVKSPLEELSLYLRAFGSWNFGSNTLEGTSGQVNSVPANEKYSNWKLLNAEEMRRLKSDSERSLLLMNSRNAPSKKETAKTFISQQKKEIKLLRSFNPKNLQKRLHYWNEFFRKSEQLRLDIGVAEDQILKRAQCWKAIKKESTSLDLLERLENSITDTETALIVMNVQKRRRLSQSTFEGTGTEELKSQLKSYNSLFQQEYQRLRYMANTCYPELKRDLNVFDQECVIIGRRLFEYDDIEPLKLNETNTSTLKKAKYKGQECVLKVFNLEGEAANERFKNEVKLLSKLIHPNIVKVEAAFRDENYGYVHLPFYKNGSLSSYLVQNPELSVADKRAIALEILCGLCFIHKNGLLHCDLKPDNILIDDSGRALIGDFDVSKDDQYKTTTISSKTIADRTKMVGTMAYFPPDQQNSTKADVYSFGLILFDMHFPPNGQDYQRPSVLTVAEQKLNIAIPETGVIGLSNLLNCLLQFDATNRLEAKDVLFTEYFTKPIAERDPSLPKLTCMICLHANSPEEGLTCESLNKNQKSHFTCKTCFNGYLHSCATLPISCWKKRNYELTCMKTFCSKKLKLSKFVGFLLPASFGAYQSVLININESRESQESEQHFEKRNDKVPKDSLVDFHAERIMEDLLELRCPSCKIEFIDFNGSFALKCNNCGCGFCAWCLQNCGADAQQHVENCPNSLTNGTIYGSMEQFEQCHRERQAYLVEKYCEQVVADPRMVEMVTESLSGLEKEL